MSGFFRSDGTTTPDRVKQGGLAGVNRSIGLYIGVVTDTKDSLFLGRITCRIPEFGSETPTNVLLVSPFGGVTNTLDAVSDVKAFGENEEVTGGTPKTYGMWPQPPAVGTEVLVGFTASRQEGFLIGTLQSKDRNHMLGGRPSGLDSDGEVNPVGEKNPRDQETFKRPKDTEFAEQLKTQGLDKDFARGHSMSSARRESPSRVFGFTTRAGHVLTMDDGTETDAGSALSRNIRIRSRGGAEILIDDTNKMIFITNHDGTAWMEMSEDGNLDVYAQDDISLHTEADFNLHAKGNINMQADKGINIRSTGEDGIKIDAFAGDLDLYTEKNYKVQAALNANLTAAGNYKEQAKRIDMNGPVPDTAKRVKVNQLPENTKIQSSAADRVPEHHPWKGASQIKEQFNNSEGNTN